MNRNYRFIVLFFNLPLLFCLCAQSLLAQGQNQPPAAPSFSSFKDAYNAGAAAAKEKRWQDSLIDFNAALPLAVTDQDKASTEKWIKSVKVQVAKGSPVLPAPTPEKS